MDWDQLEIDAYAMLDMSPHEFYELTPREYTNMMKGSQIKYERELKKGKWTAWHIACYVGMSFGGEKLPSINDILTKPIFEDKTPIPEVNLSEEEKYKKAKHKWTQIHRHGFDVPQNILDQYDIK